MIPVSAISSLLDVEKRVGTMPPRMWARNHQEKRKTEGRQLPIHP